ncbi:MAG: cysteine desulfurase [Clostridiales bacterium]|nr:cysteine desulfurase [Clostridiales bacterium]
MNVYLDNASTTKPSNEVIKEIGLAMEKFYANPSSIHALGLECEKELNKCREEIAKTINADKNEIYFTSGASEGNNLILKGLAKAGNEVLVTPFEHSSIKNTIEVLEENKVRVKYLKIDEKGRIDIEDLKNKITKETTLVSVIFVNNEIGVIQNLKEIGIAIKEISSRAKFHVDAVQGFGKIKINVNEMKIDSLVVSGHKLNGPKGIGFCYITRGLMPKPLITGGSQERGLRAGTENLPSIIGLNRAIKDAYNNLEENNKKITEIKKYMIEKLSQINGVKINSPLDEDFIPHILNVSFLGIRGEVLLHALSGDNIYVSTGSACTSKSKAGVIGSHVLEAIKLSKEEIEGAIRFSFSKDTTIKEIDYTVNCLEKHLKFLRRKK